MDDSKVNLNEGNNSAFIETVVIVRNINTHSTFLAFNLKSTPTDACTVTLNAIYMIIAVEIILALFSA